MKDLLQQIKELVVNGDVRVSDHGYDELVNDGILVREVIAGLDNSTILEHYPDFPKGSCLLILENDFSGKPIHFMGNSERRVQARGTDNRLSPRSGTMD